jgi:hypothetical protein
VYHPPPPGKGKNAAAAPAGTGEVEGPPADAPAIPQEPFSVEDPQVHAAAEAAKQA